MILGISLDYSHKTYFFSLYSFVTGYWFTIYLMSNSDWETKGMMHEGKLLSLQCHPWNICSVRILVLVSLLRLAVGDLDRGELISGWNWRCNEINEYEIDENRYTHDDITLTIHTWFNKTWRMWNRKESLSAGANIDNGKHRTHNYIDHIRPETYADQLSLVKSVDVLLPLLLPSSSSNSGTASPPTPAPHALFPDWISSISLPLPGCGGGPYLSDLFVFFSPSPPASVSFPHSPGAPREQLSCQQSPG